MCVNLLWCLQQLLRIGVNLKNFPTSAVPATFALLFHLGIAAVLLLYVLFWWKVCLTLCFYLPSSGLRLQVSKSLLLLPNNLIALVWFEDTPSESLESIILWSYPIYCFLHAFVFSCFFHVQLDLFITLKTLCFLGTFLMFVGHRILSHLASTSAKLKSAWKWKKFPFLNRWKEWGICRETVGALPIQFCRTLFGKLCYTCFLNFSADNDNVYSNMEPPYCHSLSNQLLEHLCFCHLCAYPMNFICRSGCRKRPI